MSKRGQVCAWAAAMALLSVPALAQERPAAELVELIVREGPQAVAIRARVDVVHREQLARLPYPNPELSYSREGAGFTEFLQIAQPLPWFGPRPAVQQAGLSATAAAEATRDAELRLLRADAASALARLRAGQDRLAAARAYAEELAALIAIVSTREQEGEGSRFDRLRAEQELYDAERLGAQAEVGIAAALAAVHELLPPSIRITGVTGPLYAAEALASNEQLVSRASEVRPELRSLDASAARATSEALAARRGHRPVPTVFGGLKRADVGARRETGAILGLSVTLPLANQGGPQAARWSAEAARIAADRAALAQQIRAEVEGARATLAVMQNAAATDAPESADELGRIAEIAYVEGEISIVEWLDAVRTTSRARHRSIDIRLDARLAQIALERAVGEPLWP
jgi:cobalt-zinc-cadmium efflux system outer membrane protein